MSDAQTSFWQDASVGRVPNWMWTRGLKPGTLFTNPVIVISVAAVVHLMVLTGYRWKQERQRRKGDSRRKRSEDEDSQGLDDETNPLLPTHSTPAQAKPQPVPHKGRIPWLDHAKFLAMLMVNWNHCNEMFAHAAELGPEGHPSKVIMALCDMFGLADMPIFFFCSGYVAKAEFSTTYLRAGAITLLLPCFMMDTWNTFVSNPSFTWTEKSFQLGAGKDLLFYIGYGLWENHYWYLPGLLVSRFAISIISSLKTRWLLVVCAVNLLLARGDNGTWPLSHTFEFFHVFVLGFLAKRHELLPKYLRAMERRPALRLISGTFAGLCFACCLKLGNSPHRLLFTPLCDLQPGGMDSHAMPPDSNFPLLASAVPMLYRGFFRAFYVFAWTGWLPTRDYGWLTDLGTRTLTNYLNYSLPIILLGKIGACYMLNGISSTEFCLLCFFAMPLLTAFLCSSFFTWSLWPLVTPQIWAGPLIGLPTGLPAGADERNYSLLGYWLPTFILVSAVDNLLVNSGPWNWWGPAKTGGFLHLECAKPPVWAPGFKSDYATGHYVPRLS